MKNLTYKVDEITYDKYGNSTVAVKFNNYITEKSVNWVGNPYITAMFYNITIEGKINTESYVYC